MNNINKEFIKIESERATLRKLKSKLLNIENEIYKNEKTFEDLKIKLLV